LLRPQRMLASFRSSTVLPNHNRSFTGTQRQALLLLIVSVVLVSAIILITVLPDVDLPATVLNPLIYILSLFAIIRLFAVPPGGQTRSGIETVHLLPTAIPLPRVEVSSSSLRC
jgi:hypothetical protein